jgi:predicted RNase H-like HicB family nuclease
MALQFSPAYSIYRFARYNLGTMSRIFSAILTEEEGGFIALNPDTDVASQGNTTDEALANLKEALGLYLEEATDEVRAAMPQ